MRDYSKGILLAALASAIGLASVNWGVTAETGIASHYATYDKDQPGTKTACGPPLRNAGLTAAHRTLPCGSKVRVTNDRNGRSVVVTVTDRGPYVRGRVIDLSLGAARALGFSGLTRVSIDR